MLKTFPLRSGTRQGCPLPPLLFYIVLRVLTRAIKQEKGIKGIQMGKKELKLTIYRWHNTICRKPLRLYQKTDRTNKFSNVSGYRINAKTLTFLDANNELSEKEMKKTILFTITSKRIKYLAINLTKEVKDMYTEKYKMLMKETEHNTNKKIPCANGLEEYC